MKHGLPRTPGKGQPPLLSVFILRTLKSKFRGSASCNCIRRTYGNTDSDDCYVILRTNERYPWQGSASTIYHDYHLLLLHDGASRILGYWLRYCWNDKTKRIGYNNFFIATKWPPHESECECNRSFITIGAGVYNSELQGIYTSWSMSADRSFITIGARVFDSGFKYICHEWLPWIYC